MIHLITSESIWHKFIWDKKYDRCFGLQDFDYNYEILKDKSDIEMYEKHNFFDNTKPQDIVHL